MSALRNGTFSPSRESMAANIAKKRRIDSFFRLLCAVCAFMALVFLVVLIGQILYIGLSGLDWAFLTNYASRRPADAGLRAGLIGSVWLMGIVILSAVPLGIAAAVYLEEYPMKGKINELIEVNITNLAGVPSIIFGILGLSLFVRGLNFGFSLLAGGLTLALLVLPIVIVSSREAIRAVPQAYRTASYALGATRLETIFRVVLPAAFPGIMTGVILTLSRAVGETAPLIVVGAATFIAFDPKSPMDQYTALPIQIYDWISRPQAEFQSLAATGILVLLMLMFILNGFAAFLRQRSQSKHASH